MIALVECSNTCKANGFFRRPLESTDKVAAELQCKRTYAQQKKLAQNTLVDNAKTLCPEEERQRGAMHQVLRCRVTCTAADRHRRVFYCCCEWCAGSRALDNTNAGETIHPQHQQVIQAPPVQRQEVINVVPETPVKSLLDQVGYVAVLLRTLHSIFGRWPG